MNYKKCLTLSLEIMELFENKAYRPNAHLLDIRMQYNSNIV